ncbi:hypothetical protein NGM37_06725, partial [Streptomyces sp. TRM76130]|nr:hypothetical protein [Streptomyces sp. TRM76130]
MRRASSRPPPGGATGSWGRRCGSPRRPKLSWLGIAERKSGAIPLTPAEAQSEPRNLRRIRRVQRRWGVVPLID